MPSLPSRTFKAKHWLILMVPLLTMIGAIGFVLSQPGTVTVSGTLTQDLDTTQAAPTQRPALAPPATSESIIIATPDYEALVPMPLTGTFDQTQLLAGRQTFTLWCASCHGPMGEGLAIWRFSWDTDHQDCTKAGCHGAKHPPDGFQMKSLAPALMGPGTLTKFANAGQLQGFIAAAMPYQAPGSLAPDEYWNVAAFLANQHRANANGEVLSATNGADVAFPPS
jgi:mono/diheme cytochrome c family protein